MCLYVSVWGLGKKRRKCESVCVCVHLALWVPGPLAPGMTAQGQLRKELGPPWPRTLAARDTGQEGTRGATPAGRSLQRRVEAAALSLAAWVGPGSLTLGAAPLQGNADTPNVPCEGNGDHP